MTKEEVIQHIKDWNLDNDKMEVLSVIIPELKESEDEKIRKQLLNWFKDCNLNAIDNGTLKRDDIIAWLEKQGEQKFVDKCKDCNNVKGCITCIDGDQYAHITEQKPSTFVTEFDTEVERFCKECFITDADEKGKVFCIARHFADWQKNRKNPAWSEEDKENISMLIDLVESKEESMEVKIELSAWLKSLKDRIQPQPKWSEEDEERYVSCLQRLGTGNFNQPETINTVWLKSLKERVQLV